MVYNGVWYHGTYNLDDVPGFNLGVLGPFIGFSVSTDYGKTWTPCPHTPDKPLFGESGKDGQFVKIGSPHFVDFGKNLQHSPDGKAYLVGHGAVNPDPKPRPGNLSWITGDQIYICRVTPSISNMNDSSKYEFFAGNDKNGKATWSKDFTKIKPIAEWNNNMGCVTITYNAPLNKYLMCITDGRTTLSQFNTYILESDNITGPWQLVTYLKNFGEQGYFVNIPSKFISKDGHTMWLCYSANFSGGYEGVTFESKPVGSGYAMCLQEVRLLKPTELVTKIVQSYKDAASNQAQ